MRAALLAPWLCALAAATLALNPLFHNLQVNGAGLLSDNVSLADTHLTGTLDASRLAPAVTAPGRYLSDNTYGLSATAGSYFDFTQAGEVDVPNLYIGSGGLYLQSTAGTGHAVWTVDDSNVLALTFADVVDLGGALLHTGGDVSVGNNLSAYDLSLNGGVTTLNDDGSAQIGRLGISPAGDINCGGSYYASNGAGVIDADGNFAGTSLYVAGGSSLDGGACTTDGGGNVDANSYSLLAGEVTISTGGIAFSNAGVVISWLGSDGLSADGDHVYYQDAGGTRHTLAFGP